VEDEVSLAFQILLCEPSASSGLYCLDPKKGFTMPPRVSVLERERELQELLTKPEGRKELEALQARYLAASGRVRPGKGSVITYILVYEREIGLITN